MQSNVSPAHDHFIAWCKTVGLDPNDSGLAYCAFNAGFESATTEQQNNTGAKTMNATNHSERVRMILAAHDIECWEGYAVEQYTRLGIPGESFTALSSFSTLADVYAWLGY